MAVVSARDFGQVRVLQNFDRSGGARPATIPRARSMIRRYKYAGALDALEAGTQEAGLDELDCHTSAATCWEGSGATRNRSPRTATHSRVIQTRSNSTSTWRIAASHEATRGGAARVRRRDQAEPGRGVSPVSQVELPAEAQSARAGGRRDGRSSRSSRTATHFTRRTACARPDGTRRRSR